MIGRAATAVVMVAAIGGYVASPSGAVATLPPHISVSPPHHLAKGDVVAVTATHLPGDTPVDFIECDDFDNGIDPLCGPVRASVITSHSGYAYANVTLGDPIYHSFQEFGDPRVVYCRADTCRIIAAWTDSDGNQWEAASAPLVFAGSPATISVSATTDVADGQQIVATGTALGARGSQVSYTEEACFSIVQGSGCYGEIPLAHGFVHRGGTFKHVVTVHRVLSDGTDCADVLNLLGACEISIAILGADGLPDDTYGLASRGQPAAFLTFATP
jgi:hypothetical protein